MDEAIELELPDPAATRRLGRALAAVLAPGVTVALEGELGAGKTAVAKAAIAALGGLEEADVTSPTFVLAVEYDEGRVGVLHADAYRLEGPEAFWDLGYCPLEACGRAVLVEWADRVAAALPPDRLVLALAHTPAGARRARLEARGAGGAAWLGALGEALRAAGFPAGGAEAGR